MFHTSTTRLARTLPLLALCFLPLCAGAAQPVGRGPVPWPLFDVDPAGTAWVRGETYKARFGTDGTTYFPFFGSRAPQNFPVHFQTASIHVAGESLPIAEDVPARRENARIEFERGSVRELYDVGARGIEQSFVFDSLVERGEIVVAIDVTTELEKSERDGGLSFANELGRVDYSRAFALDARDERIELTTKLVGDRLEIVVPAAFVERATLPLVIDPFVTTLAIDVDVDDDVNPDVAFDTFTGTFLVVYEQSFSAADHDILATRYSPVTLAPVATLAIDVTNEDWRSPCVAANRASSRWLCAAVVGASPNRQIRGRGVISTNLALVPPLVISTGDTGDLHDPDVGGDMTAGAPGSTDFFVVWQRDATSGDADVHGRLVNGFGSASAGAITTLAGFAAQSHTNPSISKTCGTSGATPRSWTIAIESEITTTNHDIHGVIVRADGVVTNSLFPIATSATNERDPTAAEMLVDHGAGQPWLVAYSFGLDLRMTALIGSTAQASLDIDALLLGNSLGEPDATMDGRLWQVAYRSRSGIISPGDNLRAATVSFIDGTLALAEAPTNIAATTEDESKPRIASTFVSGNPFRTFVAYQTESPTDLSNIEVGVYDSPRTAGDFAYCFGSNTGCPCANGGSGTGGCENSASTGGAVLSCSGLWFVSADSTVLNVTHLPPGAPLLYFQGTSQFTTNAPLGDGLLCVSGAITRLAIKFSAGGASSFPEAGDPDLSVAGLVPVTGGFRFYQAWHRDSGAFCTSSLFNLTNGVALLWAP